MTTDVTTRLADTIRNVLGVPDLEVTDDLTAADVEGWDSVAHVELIYALEEEFDVAFPADDMVVHENVGELRRDIERLVSGA